MAVDNGYTYVDNGDGTCDITDYDPSSSSHGFDPIIPNTLGTASLTVVSLNQSSFESKSLSSVTFNYAVDLSNSAFELNGGLAVTLNTNVTTNGVTSSIYAPFEDCNISGNFTIGSSVTTIDDFMFEYAGLHGDLSFGSALTTIKADAFANNDLSSVAFDYAISLGNNSFGQNGIIAVNLNTDVSTSAITSIIYAPFESCSISSNLTIGTSVTTIDGWMFAYSGIYGSLSFGPAIVDIQNEAFTYNAISSITFNCNANLRTSCFASTSATVLYIQLNGNLTTTGILSYGAGPFVQFYPTKTILSIANGVTSIPNYCFSSCALESVILPHSIASVGTQAFRKNDDLAVFKVYSKTTTFGSSVLDGCMSVFDKGTIYGYASSTAYTLYATYTGTYNFEYLPDYLLEIKGEDKNAYMKKNTLRVVRGIGNKNSLSVVLNCQANDWIPDVGQDVKVRDSDADILFGGVIKSLNMSKQEPRKDSDCYINVNVTSDGYESICDRRTVTLFFSNRTAGYIFEYLVDNVLNDSSNDENITKGSITSGNTFTNYSAVCKSVKDIFDDVAEQSGVQWYIDNTKTINFLQEASIATGEHTIDATGTFTDYQILGVTKSLANYCNKVFVKGQTDEVYVAVTDTSQITARISAEGTAYTSGVYGKVIEATDITSITALSTIGNNELKKYSFSPYSLQVKSYTSTWTVGTKIQVHLPEFGIDVNQEYLINQLMITKEATDIFAYEMEMVRRNSADFSTQSEDKGKEYFKRAFKFNQVSFNGYKKGETGTIINVQKQSTANYSISAETTIMSTDFTLATENDIQVNFTAICQVTGATTVTAKTYIVKDGVTSSSTFQPSSILSSKGTFNYSAFFNGITSESTTVYVTLNTDGNTISIETAEATFNLLALPQFLTE